METNTATTPDPRAAKSQRIRVARFGEPCERSRNYRDGYSEPGMSCYAIEGGVIQLEGWYFGFVARPLWIGTAEQIGTGSDGEPIVRDFRGRKASHSRKLALLPEYAREYA